MRIIFLPIEPMQERYTAQMLKWVVEDIEKVTDDFAVIHPKKSPEKIKQGQFLDSFGTISFKSSQLKMVADLFRYGHIVDGTLFLIGDTWFPGIEAIKFMADLAGVKIYLAGWHYAGVFDPHDHWAKNLGEWSRAYEKFFLEAIYDFICFGSHSHLNMIFPKLNNTGRVFSTHGLAWHPGDLIEIDGREKENIVIFPHRIAPEKNPETFVMVAEILKPKYPDWRFVFSSGRDLTPDIDLGPCELIIHQNKASYYDLLKRSKVFYSAAHQETFGYALNEAIALNCSVVAPQRLSYPEVLENDRRFLYDKSDPMGLYLLEERMNDPVPAPLEYTLKYKDSTLNWLKEIDENISGRD